MPYAFIHEVPADEEMYRKICALLPEGRPDGLIVHVATPREGGLRYYDVWESKAAWDAFHLGHVDPAVTEVLAGYGLEPDDSLSRFEELDVIDLWR